MHLNSTDNQLWQAIQHGDESAFKILFVKYYSRLCEYAYRYLSDESIIEELVADAFFKLWQKRTSIIISTSLKSYLYKTVKNQVLSYLRVQKHGLFAHSLGEANLNVPATGTNPYQQLTHQEFLSDLEERIRELPQQRQHIFRLNKLHGLSYVEIAKKLNLSEKTVKNQVFRAVQQLKQVELIILILIFF